MKTVAAKKTKKPTAKLAAPKAKKKAQRARAPKLSAKIPSGTKRRLPAGPLYSIRVLSDELFHGENYAQIRTLDNKGNQIGDDIVAKHVTVLGRADLLRLTETEAYDGCGYTRNINNNVAVMQTRDAIEYIA